MKKSLRARKRNLSIRSDSGFTLVEILIAIAMAGVTIVTAYTFFIYVSQQAQRIITLQTRDSIHSELLRNLGDMKTIVVSRAKDPTFDACFKAGAYRNVCPGGSETSVTLHSPSGNLLSGTPEHPAYFNFMGMPCTWPSPNCILKVESYVRAQGIPDWQQNGKLVTTKPSDFGNEIVEVRFKVSVVNYPELQARPLSGSIIFDIADFLNSPPKAPTPTPTPTPTP